MKRPVAAFAAFLLSLSLVSVAVAQSLPAPAIAAKSWLLLDAGSGQVLAAQDPARRIEPASLAKIMTTYLVFQALQDKRITMEQSVTVSTRAWKTASDGSKMFIDPKTPVTIKDLLYGLIVSSGNDAAVALAEAVSGSEDTFVAQMNKAAQDMGLKNTRFANAHGLPSAENYSTAQDLALLTDRLVNDFPEYYKIFAVKSYTYNRITQQNRNRLLWLDPSVDGVKTGHTQAAGYCLIASARRPNGKSGERRLISVVIGATSDSVRSQESQKLLNWGFLNFDTVKLYAKGQPVLTPPVWKGSQSEVKLGFDHDVYVTVPKGAAERIKPVVERREPLVAPIPEHMRVGTMKLMDEGKTIAEVPLVTLEPVSQATIFGRAWDSLRLWIK
ncbi:D-alanyl-D-alanine carboxypeptidase family protein [Noviherbaspirillum pedocola]|uniref:serine-type D-Ala-D-Ala carboxypeptidase n=1 Tax=Noviherbaspirillum pedocola TaxID=2801341 RepID=A0A934STC0_9BURK|nr:D-alanyl-D-alanine carboxypeptidase family protein [Noviherbaspirillum pedocola]MBK4736411.1 D-alanyl-D-alanine carboxypeptidase [Noviherbaspirillum pedocola]